MSERMFGYYLRGQSIFEGLDESQIHKLHAAAKQHVLKKRSRIVINNIKKNRIYFLIKGKVKVVSSIEKNSVQVKDILYQGEMFGNVSLNGFRGEEYAEALVNNTVIYCFSTKDFREFIHYNHRLAINYAHSISKKLFVLNERYEVWTRRDAKTRFIFMLRNWAAAEGQSSGQFVLLNNHLSLSEIADILSVSRQFLHRLIKEMDNAGMMKFSRKEIVVSKSLLDHGDASIN